MKLSIFNELNFLPALRALFKELQVPINAVTDSSINARDILTNTYRDHESFNLIDDVYFLGMVDDAAFRGGKSLDLSQIKSDYDGILIFGVTLQGRDGGLLPTRSQLAEISRSFNREFCYTPVVVVFKYADADNTYLAFANTERLKYKDNREGEKAGKVTLLRDINISQPHSGHERILANLAISDTGKNKVDSFASLYKYWQEVLSVSLLNKKFYQDLSNWYFWAVEHVTFPSEPTLLEVHAKKVSLEDLQKEHKAKNVIRMLTRLLFVWFIKEKGLIPPELFELDDLQRDILKNISPYNDLGLFKQVNQESIYYKAILQNLFFATLNCPIKPMESHDNRVRGFRKMDNYGQHRDANFLMRYEKHFQNPVRFLEMVNDVVPFLNGGLFECLDDKLNKIYIDGFSDNLTKGEQLIVPDYLFFGVEEKVDLSAEYGVTNKATKEAAVKGLINILKAYKFTITENTPIEEDVALDPELLGKVFENLLASYNPETKTTARKQTGSFYTPREIVNYMVDESLIAYLKNELLAQESGYQEEDLDRQLRQLVSFDAVNPFDGNADVQKRIIKALDKCTILDPACGSGAFPMGILQNMVHILFKVDPKNTEWKQRQIVRVEAAINQLEELEDAQYREQGIQDLNAQIKDIEEAFANNELDYGRKLYLIENCIYGVDIQSIATQISKLRFFISLVVDQRVDPSKDNFGIRPLPNLETKFVAANTLIGIEKPKAQLSLFDTPEIRKLEADLKKVRHRLFSSKSPSHKRKLREQDKALREQIAAVLQNNGWNPDTANQLANWDPYNLNDSAGFFDPEWMFDISDGFNITIGNPPYGAKFNAFEKKYIKENYFSMEGDYESYIYFIERNLKLISIGGILNFIVPNTFLMQWFSGNIRKIILEKTILQIIDLGFNIFESAVVPTAILMVQNKKADDNILRFKDQRTELLNNFFYFIKQKEFTRLPKNQFNLSLTPTNLFIYNELLKSSIPLEEIAEIKIGIECKPEFISDSNDSEYHKPMVRGRNFDRFITYFNREPKYVLYKRELLHRPREERLFLADEKILIRQTGDKIVAAVDNEKLYAWKSVFVLLISDPRFELKYILALLNSKVINYFYNIIVGELGRTFAQVKGVNLNQLPIKSIDKKEQYLFVQLSNIIIFLKSKNADAIFFEALVDHAILELYFFEHMKEREIDILHLLNKDIKQVFQNKNLDGLTELEKEKLINLLHDKWINPDNEVRDRIKLFAVRSPDILKPILESK